MDIGQKIRYLRERNNMSLRELGEKADVSHSFLSRIENGQQRPNLNHLQKLAEIFDVHESYFFGDLQETPDELKEYVDWIAFGKEMEDEELTPDKVREIIDFVKKIREI